MTDNHPHVLDRPWALAGSLTQRYCPPCQREVERIVAADAKRRTPRWSVPKDLSGLTGVVL